MGIEIRPANINKSSDSYKIERGRLSNGKEGYFLRTPLTSIAGIGDKAVSSILAAQPFSSFKDFLAKIDARQVNKKVFASLVGEGCMDDIWGLARPEMISKYEEVKKAADKEKKSKKKQIEHEGSMGGSIFDMDTGSIQI
jgi:DNA polymerase-3 subunit alpha